MIFAGLVLIWGKHFPTSAAFHDAATTLSTGLQASSVVFRPPQHGAIL
jgi:hypothetical protein